MTFYGGPVFWILVVMSVASVVIFLGRFLELRRLRIDAGDFVHGIINILDRGGDTEALAICEDTPVPVAAVVAAAVRQRTAPARVLREAVDAQGRAELSRLDRRLAVLAIIGQVAPMVGLFGTLLGFVRTLTAANAAAVVSRPEFLSAAVQSVTLTAFGIAVSIVASVFFGVLRVRTDRLTVDLESAASSIVGHIAVMESRR